jgi:hypothetical protein
MEEEVVNYMDDPLEGQQIWFVLVESYHECNPPPHQPSQLGNHSPEDDTLVVLGDMIHDLLGTQHAKVDPLKIKPFNLVISTPLSYQLVGGAQQRIHDWEDLVD